MSGTGRLLHRVLRDCARWNVKVELTPNKLRNAYGYFDDAGRRLVVSTQPSDWVTTLAHEFGHVMQWKRGLWFDEYEEGSDPWVLLAEWLDGARRALRAVEWAATEVQACELDAERRALRLLRHYEVEFDEVHFIKCANLNIFTYDLNLLWRAPVSGLSRIPALYQAANGGRILTSQPRSLFDLAERYEDEICK